MARTVCARAGEPLLERDIAAGTIWCRDCREVDSELYEALTGKTLKTRRVDVQEALRLRRSGLNNSQIAARLGVANSSVGRALKRAAA